MGFQEHRPRHLLAPCGSGLDAVIRKDVSNGPAPDFVSEVTHRTHDAGVPPPGVIGGHAHNQRLDLCARAWSSWSTTLPESPLPGYQLAVPAKQRVGGDDWVQLREGLATDRVGPACQQSTLGVGE